MEARLLERGKTSGRTDDNIESIRKRFRTYQNETTPIISYYEFMQLVHKIDGTKEVDSVWAETQAAIGQIEERFTGSSSIAVHLYAVEGEVCAPRGSSGCTPP